MTRIPIARALIACAVAAAWAASALAAPPATPPAPPKPPATGPTTDPPASDKPAPGKPRSLDELLGTGGGAPPRDAGKEEVLPDAAGPGAAEEQRQGELRRALTEEEANEAFVKAVAQMARSARLLGEARDPGLDTQRVQEEVLRTLDDLLRQPPRRNRSSSSSSSSSSAQQREDPQSTPPSAPQPAGQNAGQRRQPGEASDSSETAGSVPLQEGALEEALESAGAEWGNLPERVRDMIRQGLRDRPSSLYRRLTESYYRRLAEESSR